MTVKFGLTGPGDAIRMSVTGSVAGTVGSIVAAARRSVTGSSGPVRTVSRSRPDF